jgi:hypothetical protein
MADLARSQKQTGAGGVNGRGENGVGEMESEVKEKGASPAPLASEGPQTPRPPHRSGGRHAKTTTPVVGVHVIPGAAATLEKIAGCSPGKDHTGSRPTPYAFSSCFVRAVLPPFVCPFVSLPRLSLIAKSGEIVFPYSSIDELFCLYCDPQTSCSITLHHPLLFVYCLFLPVEA